MIYLDHAAATPVSTKALDAMLPYFSESFFNPSAAYLPAKKIRADYEDAKNRIAHCIGARGNDLVITSGATEANNLAFSFVQKQCLYLETEHDSVRNVAKQHNGISIKVDKTGLIDLNDLKNKLTDDIELISISLANNELGTIQPLAEISAIIKNERLKRLFKNNQTPIYLHSDASQAENLIDINVSRLGIDLLTINSAKVYGPKGVGALYVAHGVTLTPISYGGGQENNLRSGTENIPGVIGFAVAFEHAKQHLNGNRKKYEKMVKILHEKLPQNTIFLGNRKHQLANFCPISIPDIDAERLIFKLENSEVYLSTGAACAANKGAKSHVLMAIGLSEQEITGSLRISLGELNTEENVSVAAELISKAIQEEYNRKKNKAL